jgi:hypothetical protein
LLSPHRAARGSIVRRAARNIFSKDSTFFQALLSLVRYTEHRQRIQPHEIGGGALTFSAIGLDGKPFIAADAKYSEVLIYGVSGILARSFIWKLK